MDNNIRMSAPLTPSKRPHDDESDGKEKLPKLGGNRSPDKTSNSSFSNVGFRVLCPVSKVDYIIERSKSHVREDTGVNIRVEEMVSGCDERVVVIGGSYEEPNVSVKQSKDDGGEEGNVAEDDENKEEDSKDKKDKEPAPINDSQYEDKSSNLQKALLVVFEKIVEANKETDGSEKNNKSSKFVLRLLVLSSQVGRVLGKGGSVIKQTASESGAEIRVLPRDKLPVCASASDEVVQASHFCHTLCYPYNTPLITGGFHIIKQPDSPILTMKIFNKGLSLICFLSLQFLDNYIGSYVSFHFSK